ncbi:MAG: hypothetical protein RIT81_42800 [Deltaproteobacteria bacterium]
MKKVWIVGLFVSFIVAVGCKDEQEKVKEAMANAEAAKKQALEAAKVAEQAAKEAAKVAKEAADDGEEAADDATDAADPKNLQEAMAEMQKAIAKNTSNVEPVNFRELKKMLPDEAAGLKRTNAKGEKAGAMGMKISNAEGKYEADGKRLTVKIIDMGSMKGFAAMAAAGWAMAEIDRESDDGYERTSKIDGHKSYEKWSSKTMRGQVKLILADRFMVEVEGRKVPMKDLLATAKGLPLDDLVDMKDEGVKD